MTRKKNNIGGLLAGLGKTEKEEKTESADSKVSAETKGVVNPAIDLATGNSVKRAVSVKEPVLQLQHDQVILFKYHDRHKSSLDSAKVAQLRKSIEAEEQHTPGTVRKTDKTTSDGRVIYELIVGRLRFEASRGVGVFKAFLKDLDDAAAVKLMFSENEDRLDITPFERWLSVLPLVEDRVMGVQDIAESIGWDKGNLSRSLKAKKVYEECELENYLVDVSKVKLNPLIELSKVYEEKPDSVKESIKFVEEKYPGRKDTIFLRSILKHMKEIIVGDTEKVFLTGSKATLVKKGDNVSISFQGLPKESDFETIIESMKKIKAFR
jgi:ParB family chromosome partitioning protein